jgi:hypothetical protein
VIGQGHKRPPAIIRIALIVTYLSFFVTQLSYKYYFCASFPCYFSGYQGASSCQVKGTVIPGPNDMHILSLDKRFDGKHVARMSPNIVIAPPAYALRAFVQQPPVSLLHILPPAAVQRGPPFRV